MLIKKKKKKAKLFLYIWIYHHYHALKATHPSPYALSSYAFNTVFLYLSVSFSIRLMCFFFNYFLKPLS